MMRSTRMERSICTLLWITMCCLTQAQETPRDSLIARRVPVAAFDLGIPDPPTLGSFFNNIYNADRSKSYVLGPFAEKVRASHDDIAPLQSGEGSEDYLFEVNIDLFYPIITGRNSEKFLPAGSRGGLLFNTTTRMVNEGSHPLLPNNWMAGLHADIPIHLSVFGDERKLAKSTLVRNTNRSGQRTEEAMDTLKQFNWSIRHDRNQRVLEEAEQGFSYAYGSVSCMHYSNGQDTGVYYLATPPRHDYRNGDFSTNFLKVGLHYAVQTRTRDLFIASVGYRYEIDGGGVFAFMDEQKGSYGRQRILGSLVWRSKAQERLLGLFRWRLTKPFEYDGHRYRLREMFQTRVKVEATHIADDLGRYSHDRPYRTGIEAVLEVQRLRDYAIGLIVRGYTGRDYLNIRYDRVITLVNIGLSFTWERYQPYGWRQAEAIIP